jgi:hypothetical protein
VGVEASGGEAVGGGGESGGEVGQRPLQSGLGAAAAEKRKMRPLRRGSVLWRSVSCAGGDMVWSCVCGDIGGGWVCQRVRVGPLSIHSTPQNEGLPNP